MSLKDMFSPEEWSDLTNAPLAAGLYLASGEPHPFHMVEDMKAMSKAVRGATDTYHSNPLIREILEEKLGSERYSIVSAPDQAPREIKPSLLNSDLEIVRRAGKAVSRMAGQDADEYKRWVMSVAQKVAEASKEGGLLGFGGIRVSADETAALKEIAEAIGYKG